MSSIKRIIDPDKIYFETEPPSGLSGDKNLSEFGSFSPRVKESPKPNVAISTRIDSLAGKLRQAGERVNVDYLRTIGVDPSKVLFFRITQPMQGEPKPEYYWTSDFIETAGGLGVEIPPQQRETAIILVSDLQTINENGGLIQDINDDNGLAVRQINQGPFDQKKAITQIPAKEISL